MCVHAVTLRLLASLGVWRLAAVRLQVTSVVVEVVGETSVASTVSYIDNSFVFVGSVYVPSPPLPPPPPMRPPCFAQELQLLLDSPPPGCQLCP